MSDQHVLNKSVCFSLDCGFDCGWEYINLYIASGTKRCICHCLLFHIRMTLSHGFFHPNTIVDVYYCPCEVWWAILHDIIQCAGIIDGRFMSVTGTATSHPVPILNLLWQWGFCLLDTIAYYNIHNAQSHDDERCNNHILYFIIIPLSKQSRWYFLYELHALYVC